MQEVQATPGCQFDPVSNNLRHPEPVSNAVTTNGFRDFYTLLFCPNAWQTALVQCHNFTVPCSRGRRSDSPGSEWLRDPGRCSAEPPISHKSNMYACMPVCISLRTLGRGCTAIAAGAPT